MKKNTRLLPALVALLVLMGLLAGLYLSCRPSGSDGVKSVSVEVVHADGTAKRFDYETDKEYLGQLLLSEDLIKGDAGPYGLYITEVDGEVAIYEQNKAYWALFDGDSYATQGADTTPLTDGGQYRLVYTIG